VVKSLSRRQCVLTGDEKPDGSDSRRQHLAKHFRGTYGSIGISASQSTDKIYQSSLNTEFIKFISRKIL